MNVEKDPYLRSPWHLDLSGGDVLYLAATTLIYSFFVFAIEFLRTKKFCTRRLPKKYTSLPLYHNTNFFLKFG